ncbi:MAG: RHS repeat-associated core domain-containing protein, partial [Bacteroidales bacterium]|nr:RHS repeat-associated core domain-containing protein [Bacteroidales bacterium]
DRNKGIHSITYNMLNLPQTILFNDGHETRYTYAADGRKLRVQYLLNNFAIFDGEEAEDGGEDGVEMMPFSLASTNDFVVGGGSHNDLEEAVTTLMVRDYCGNHTYRNGVLERTLTDVGYIDSTGSHYYVKDYRGDIRTTVSQNGTLKEVNSYYPYGMLHGTSAIASAHPYKYTGKELDRENGLDWYDFEARMLNSSLCYWIMPDPLAELDVDASPYSVCKGNPNSNSDPSGMIVNNIIGGIVGGLAEYATQVSVNLLSGKKMSSFTDVDIADIAVATVEGAITSGGSVVRRTIVKGTAMAVRNSVDYNVHDGLKIKSAKKAAQAMATEVASSIIKMPIKHVSVFKTKSANKAVNEARAKAHAKGQSLPAKKAKQIATRTRKRNARAKKTNKAVTDKVKSAPGNIGAGYVNKQNDKE